MTNNTEVSLDNVIEALSRTKISKEESDEHGFVFKLSPNQLLALILDSIPAACEPATVQECETVYQHLDSKGTQYINGKGFVMELYWTDCTYKQYEKESNGNRRILYTHPPIKEK